MYTANGAETGNGGPLAGIPLAADLHYNDLNTFV
ncbi:hypothetical protein COHCIP112018_01925 [Cohnella sp. JJ-181]|nr:hypothetical protein COHCIP112018_01925 [Cohnella sp. JJ-181]